MSENCSTCKHSEGVVKVNIKREVIPSYLNCKKSKETVTTHDWCYSYKKTKKNIILVTTETT